MGWDYTHATHCTRTGAIDRIFTEDEKTALNEYYENY